MPDDIEDLTHQLTTTLTSPQTSETLDRQTQILDQIFTSVMADKVAARLSKCDQWPERTMAWLTLALQIQKQCVNTVKSKAAIDYMNGLTPNLPRQRDLACDTAQAQSHSQPIAQAKQQSHKSNIEGGPPPKIEKQKEGS